MGEWEACVEYADEPGDSGPDGCALDRGGGEVGINGDVAGSRAGIVEQSMEAEEGWSRMLGARRRRLQSGGRLALPVTHRPAVRVQLGCRSPDSAGVGGIGGSDAICLANEEWRRVREAADKAAQV